MLLCDSNNQWKYWKLSGKIATFYLTRIMMRDQDVKPTPSRDLDIKRDYQLILRYCWVMVGGSGDFITGHMAALSLLSRLKK